MKIKEVFFAALARLGIASPAKSHWLECAAEVGRAHSRGELTAAVKIADRCLRTGEPEQSPDYLVFLNNIGLLYSESGNSELAIKTKQSALELSRSLYSLGHQQIVDAQLGLAVAHLYAGDAAKALPLLIEAQGLASGDSFRTPELALRVMRTLASAHDMLGDLTQALPVARQAYAMAVSQQVSSLELSLFQTELGLVLIRNGQSEDALGLLEAAYAARTRESPEGSYGVASAAHNLGWANEALCRWGLAQEFYENALRWKVVHLGESSPATMRSREGLSRTQAKTGCPR